MKNIYKIFALAIVAGVFLTSCGDEPYDIEDGGNLGESIAPPTSASFIYEVTTDVTFGLDPTDNGIGITSISATKRLYTSLGESEEVTLNVSSGTLSQTMSELFADVPVAGNVLNQDDLLPGDFWAITYEVVANNGMTYTVPYNLYDYVTVAGDEVKIPATTFVNFACPSEIPVADADLAADGTPDVVWSGTTQNGVFGVVSSSDNIVITAIKGDGNYSISDVTAGYYTAFGASWNQNQPVTFNELCKTIKILESDAQVIIATTAGGGNGTWDDVTQTLTIPWHDTTNDFVEVTVFTVN